jgi:hypothetical protein
MAAVLAACGTGRTLVMEPPAKKSTFLSAQIVQEDSTVTVPTEVQAKFKTLLAQKLFDTSKGRFTEGQGLVVKYRFIQYTEGARFNRWFFGGIGNSGEASATLKVDFFDPAGTRLGTIQVEGRIGSGFFGGSAADTLDKAGDQIVTYAVANFR